MDYGSQIDIDLSDDEEDDLPKRIEIDEDRLTHLHAEGKSDSEIAKELGCSAGTILYHRKTLGLAANSRKGRKRAVPSTAIVPAGRMLPVPLRKRGNSANGGLIAIHVSERVLDFIWSGLPPATKGDLLNGLEEIID